MSSRAGGVLLILLYIKGTAHERPKRFGECILGTTSGAVGRCVEEDENTVLEISIISHSDRPF